MPAENAQSNEMLIKLLWKRCRTELLMRPVFYFLVVLGLVLLVLVFYWPIAVTRKASLTPLEQVLFELSLAFLSCAIAWALAKKGEERNVLEKQKALARSAVRRINGIAAAAARLFQSIEARKESVKSAPEWGDPKATSRTLLLEIFDSLTRQVTDMRENIAASEGDWRDILPEEFAKKEEAEREILNARERAIFEREKAYEELQRAVAQGQAHTAEQLEALNESLEKQLVAVEERLALEVEKIRSELPPTVSQANPFFSFGSPYAVPEPGEVFSFKVPSTVPLSSLVTAPWRPSRAHAPRPRKVGAPAAVASSNAAEEKKEPKGEVQERATDTVAGKG